MNSFFSFSVASLKQSSFIFLVEYWQIFIDFLKLSQGCKYMATCLVFGLGFNLKKGMFFLGFVEVELFV